jgi:hypothetical protein
MGKSFQESLQRTGDYIFGSGNNSLLGDVESFIEDDVLTGDIFDPKSTEVFGETADQIKEKYNSFSTDEERQAFREKTGYFLKTNEEGEVEGVFKEKTRSERISEAAEGVQGLLAPPKISPKSSGSIPNPVAIPRGSVGYRPVQNPYEEGLRSIRRLQGAGSYNTSAENIINQMSKYQIRPMILKSLI